MFACTYLVTGDAGLLHRYARVGLCMAGADNPCSLHFTDCHLSVFSFFLLILVLSQGGAINRAVFGNAYFNDWHLLPARYGKGHSPKAVDKE